MFPLDFGAQNRQIFWFGRLETIRKLSHGSIPMPLFGKGQGNVGGKAASIKPGF